MDWLSMTIPYIIEDMITIKTTTSFISLKLEDSWLRNVLVQWILKSSRNIEILISSSNLVKTTLISILLVI